VSARFRTALFLGGAAGVAALLLWSLAGLPDFGSYRGAYGHVLNHVAVKERRTTNVVTAVVFDYRGLDTMGEQFILFISVVGVALLLRETRGPKGDLPRRLDLQAGDAIRAVGLAAVALTLLTGLWVVAHGTITPGGGFQGGVVLASGLLLVYLGGDYAALRRVAPIPFVDLGEGAGAGAYIVVGLVALLLGTPFLHNLLPLGKAGTLTSGGSIEMLNVAIGLEVAAALTLLFIEFLEELAAERPLRHR
jgi:multicomponent Na+:H+ antiporter subunit B